MRSSAEVPARHRQTLGVLKGADGGGTRVAFEQGHLAEEVAGTQGGCQMRVSAVGTQNDLDLAGGDEEEAGRLVVLLDDDLARLEAPRDHELGQSPPVASVQLREDRHLFQKLFATHGSTSRSLRALAYGILIKLSETVNNAEAREA